MADFSREIDQLEKIVNGAASSVTVDGATVRYSIPQARKRLSELRNQDATSIAAETVRPVLTRIKLTSCF